MPKISVIIPVYNTEKDLPTCLESLLAQTFHDFEVICVNDGSTDTCPRILADFVGRDHRFHLINQPNQGQSVARNTGLDKAQGGYIFFLDSDDSLPNFALETLFKIAEESRADIVVSRSLHGETLARGQALYQMHSHSFFDFVHDKRIFSTPCNKLYRSELLKNHRFIPGICFEDWPFLTILFGKIASYASTNVGCYLYNENNTSTTRSVFTSKKVDSYLTGIRAVYDFYKTRPDLALAQKRMAVAIKMMVNKVYKTNDPELTRHMLSHLTDLFNQGVIQRHQLSFKTLFRLWKMRLMK